jgi:hypothetical protein
LAGEGLSVVKRAHLFERLGIADVALDQADGLWQGPAIARVEIVENGDIAACLDQLVHNVRADVASTAGDQEVGSRERAGFVGISGARARG